MNTNDLIELSNMTPEQLRERFTEEEMVEINKKLQEELLKAQEETFKAELKCIELEQKHKETQERLRNSRETFLKRWGPKPFLSVLTRDDIFPNVELNLIIDGEMNIFPERLSVFDAYELMDCVGKLLRIPDKRMQVGNSVLEIPEEQIRIIPWAGADLGYYGRKLIKWLMEEVTPKPKIVHKWFIEMYQQTT